MDARDQWWSSRRAFSDLRNLTRATRARHACSHEHAASRRAPQPASGLLLRLSRDQERQSILRLPRRAGYDAIGRVHHARIWANPLVRRRAPSIQTTPPSPLRSPGSRWRENEAIARVAAAARSVPVETNRPVEAAVAAQLKPGGSRGRLRAVDLGQARTRPCVGAQSRGQTSQSPISGCRFASRSGRLVGASSGAPATRPRRQRARACSSLLDARKAGAPQDGKDHAECEGRGVSPRPRPTPMG